MSTIADLGPDDFLAAEQNLLPPGDALTRDPMALLTTLLAGLSGRMAAVHARVGDLTEVEADPRQTTELLPDWESSFGLPDPCLGISPTLGQRRAQLVARIAGQGGQDEDYFIAYAAALGYAITITTYPVFRVGMRVGSRLFGTNWLYVWQVNAPAFTIDVFRVGANRVGDRLAIWGNTALQCELQRINPAHTHLIFNYS